MPLSQLIADCEDHRERLAETNGTWEPRHEFQEQVWPWLRALAETVNGNLAEHATAIGELIHRSDNLLQPEFAARILEVFELGKVLCSELEGLDIPDDRREKLTGLLAAYRQDCETVTLEVASVTLDDDDDDQVIEEALAGEEQP